MGPGGGIRRLYTYIHQQLVVEHTHRVPVDKDSLIEVLESDKLVLQGCLSPTEK